MAVNLSPLFNDAQFINAIPATGALLYTYQAGSSAKLNTYTDSAGLTPQANPIVLNSRGEPASPIWLTAGQSYKFVFAPSTDSDPPVSPIRTIDNVRGVNDTTSTVDQWIASNLTPTYISATQLTLVGDQTGQFQVNRRIKCSVTAGTVYGYIYASAYTTLTTVTVVLDSGSLDSGLSAVSYGIITPNNTSLPDQFPVVDTKAILKGSSDATKQVKFEVDGLTTATTRTITLPDKSGTLAMLDDAGQLESISASTATNALTGTFNGGVLDFRSATLTTGTPVQVSVGSNSITIPSTSSLGVTTATSGRLVLLEAYNGGTPVACWVNLAGGLQLDETNLISPTTIGAASNSANVIYSASAVSANSPYRVVGFVDCVWTSGTGWSSPTLVQGASYQTVAMLTKINQGVVQNTTSGTSIDFTGIPSFAKRIRLHLIGCSLSGSAHILVQGGVGTSPTTSGYSASGSALVYGTNSTLTTTSSAGLPVYLGNSVNVVSAVVEFTRIPGTNQYLINEYGGGSNSGICGSAIVTLSGDLGMIRLTSTNGTDTFDAGQAFVAWE